MRFLCPNCHRELEIPDAAAGAAGTCYHCGASIIAPTSAGQPAMLARDPGAPPPPPGAAPGPQAPYGRVQPADIVSEAWRTLWANFGPIAISFYLAAVSVSIVSALIAAPYFLSFIQASDMPADGLAPVMPWYLYVGNLVVYTALAPLLAGPLYVVDEILTRGTAEISTTFRGFQHYGQLALFGFLYTLPTTVCGLLDSVTPATAVGETRLWQALSGLLSILMATFFALGVMEVVDRGSDAVTAFQESWKFTRGNRWRIVFSWLLLFLVAAAGVIACCVGYFVTILVIPVGLVLMYRDLRGLTGAPAS